jgi:hypothetical protein
MATPLISGGYVSVTTAMCTGAFCVYATGLQDKTMRFLFRFGDKKTLRF